MLSRILTRLRGLLQQPRVARELDDELGFHVEMETAANIGRGMSPGEARRAALRDLGGIEPTKEAIRDVRAFVMDELWQDLRYAARSLRKHPGFAAAAILTLALAIGANTAIFSVVYGVLLRPLPYRDPDRLVRLLEHIPAERQRDRQPRVSEEVLANDFLAWNSESRTLSHLAVFDAGIGLTLGLPSDRTRVAAAQVTPSLFPLLGMDPVQGRVFDERDGPRVAVISDALWLRAFGRDPSVLERTLTLDGNDYLVVGIMPESFEFPERDTSVWVPLEPKATSNGELTSYSFVGRLADGATAVQAEVEAETILKGEAGYIWPEEGRRPDFEVVTMKERAVAPVRRALLVLLGGVGLVLLIGFSNVANLMLARQASRQRDAAVRVALGAGRGRLTRQMLTESLLLSVMGGTSGVLIAVVGVDLLRALVPADVPRMSDVRIDGPVLAYTMVASAAIGIVLGFVPIGRMFRTSPIHAIKAGAGTTTGARMGTRRSFVAAQVALAAILLVGGGLLTRSFLGLMAVEPGFNVDNLLVVQVALPPSGPARAAAVLLTDSFRARLETVPGVTGVAFANQLPLRRRSGTMPRIDGIPGNESRAEARIVSTNYLDVMRIDLVEGRAFDASDAGGQPDVVLINRSGARAFGERGAIGQIVTVAGRPAEIVGVVEDTHEFGLDRAPMPQVYIDARQSALRMLRADRAIEWGFFAIRTSADTASVLPDVRRLLYEMVPDATLELNVSSMADIVTDTVAARRFYALIVGMFALLAVTLAAVGVYGVMTYTITERIRELGIRAALGAAHRDLVALVLGQSVLVTLTGLALGLVGAAVTTRFLQGMLFGLTPLDPATFALVATILGGVSTLAAYLPARRAAHADPLVALRAE